VTRIAIADDCRSAPQARLKARQVVRARRTRTGLPTPPQPGEITAVHLVDDITPVAGAARLALIQAFPAPGIARITEAVCDHYGLTPLDVISDVQTQRIARARHVAIYLCRSITDHSSPEIGRRFGDRDHKTVLAAVHSIAAAMDHEPQLIKDIDEIKEKLSRPSG
jgi:hypothetical protein